MHLARFAQHSYGLALVLVVPLALLSFPSKSRTEELALERPLTAPEQLQIMISTSYATCLAHVDSVLNPRPDRFGTVMPIKILVVRPYKWFTPAPPKRSRLRVEVSLAKATEIASTLANQNGQLDILLGIREHYTAEDARRLSVRPPEAPWRIGEESFEPALSQIMLDPRNPTMRTALEQRILFAQSSQSLQAMTNQADLIVVGKRDAQRFPRRYAPTGGSMKFYTIDTTVVGATPYKTVAVFASPPRQMPKGPVLLFLKHEGGDTFRIVGMGHGALPIENGVVAKLELPLNSAVAQIATFRATKVKEVTR